MAPALLPHLTSSEVEAIAAVIRALLLSVRTQGSSRSGPDVMDFVMSWATKTEMDHRAEL